MNFKSTTRSAKSCTGTLVLLIAVLFSSADFSLLTNNHNHGRVAFSVRQRPHHSSCAIFAEVPGRRESSRTPVLASRPKHRIPLVINAFWSLGTDSVVITESPNILLESPKHNNQLGNNIESLQKFTALHFIKLISLLRS